MKRLFGTQGFRGIANESLTASVAHDLGLSLATHLERKGTVAVGWDSRTSSEMLSYALSAGLMSGGCGVRLVGLVPTPLLSFTIPRLGCTAGVMVTASHNPPEYNGIKILGDDGAALTAEAEREIEGHYAAEKWGRVPWDLCGHLQPTEDLRPRYIHYLLDRVNAPSIKRQKFHIIADCGGGTAGVIIPELLNRLGCELEVLNCTPDGFFEGRHPEPKEDNLGELIQQVEEKSADLGIAWDGDADRVVFITNKGQFLMGDRSFALAAFHWFQHIKESEKKVVTQVATSDVIRDIATAVDAEVILTRVGEPNIVQKMKEVEAQIGGEENGGVIYRGWSWTREGMLTTLVVLDFLAQEGTSLDKINRQFPSYAQVKDSIPCDDHEKTPLLEQVTSIIPSDAEEYNTLDGVKLRYSDGWLLLRPSGTEPIFRVFSEAKTASRAKNLVKKGLTLLRDAYAEMTSGKK